MGDGEALWRAFEATPGDAPTCLALADWLEEDAERAKAFWRAAGNDFIWVCWDGVPFALRWMARNGKCPRRLKGGRWRWYYVGGGKKHRLDPPLFDGPDTLSRVFGRSLVVQVGIVAYTLRWVRQALGL